jgi:hypothetical protein
MGETTTLSKQSIETLRTGGVSGLARQGLLYLVRRLNWRSDEWAKNLDISILRRRLLREYGPLLKRNEIFRDRHKGKRCFVLGNGPSLKRQDLSAIVNEVTFVTNSFYLHPLVGETWQPTYYFLSDPQYFDGSLDLSEMTAIASRITTAPFFVPFYAHKVLQDSQVLPLDRTYYVAAGGERLDRVQKKPDFTTVTPGMQTVVQLAMMAAMYMGCSTIYLMGLDHDWLSHFGEEVHFYGEHEADDQPDGHVGQWTYLSLMEAMTMMWQHYLMLSRIARNEGIKIINCTGGGFLDVFERANYEQIVNVKP